MSSDNFKPQFLKGLRVLPAVDCNIRGIYLFSENDVWIFVKKISLQPIVQHKLMTFAISDWNFCCQYHTAALRKIMPEKIFSNHQTKYLSFEIFFQSPATKYIKLRVYVG